MTGSASRGRHKDYYPYYHCKSTCGVRFKADLVNTLFARNLKQFVPKPGMAELFTAVVCDSYIANGGAWRTDQSRIIDTITGQNNRMTKSMELLLNEVITGSEYKQIKKKCENTIARCEAELKELNQQVEEDLDIEGLAALATENLKKLPDFYANADSDIKRAIVGSIYPEKWVFDGESRRTPEVNEAALLIYHINRKLWHKKTEEKFLKESYSGLVHFPGLFSNQFLDDLKKIANLDTLFHSEPLRRDFKLRYKRCYTSQERRDKPLTQVWAENGFTKYKPD